MPIGGMTCAHCVDAVTRGLSALPGVSSVKVNLRKGEAEVFGSGLDIAKLKAAVEDLGYDAGEIG
ncbi:MAG: heavy-metal-associated domain-containing protein [Planctomycetota bacterium]|nr:heavy-metal-associated domain-containing protein [Planctomycetota bacterium]